MIHPASNRSRARSSAIAASVVAALVGGPTSAIAQSTTLYSNDFESPNEPVIGTCVPVLDQRGINRLYGTLQFQFQQTFTVEVFRLAGDASYSDPAEVMDEFALGMLATRQDDLLALIFDAGTFNFVNVGFDLAPTDIIGCGGPIGFAVPIMRVSAHDAPGGAFSITDPGPALAEGTVTGTATSDFRVLRWTYGTASLDISGSTDGQIALLFDLRQSGYGLIDNLSVVASNQQDVFDRDTDGVPDDEDNCPDIANEDQEDGDEDGVGDVCDPAPDDPNICGDADDDGEDDCAPPPDAGVAEDATAPVDAGGARDAAGEPDSGAVMDAGFEPPVDAGPPPPTTTAPNEDNDDGCGCSTSGRGEDSAFAVLLGLVLLGVLADPRPLSQRMTIRTGCIVRGPNPPRRRGTDLARAFGWAKIAACRPRRRRKNARPSSR